MFFYTFSNATKFSQNVLWLLLFKVLHLLSPALHFWQRNEFTNSFSVLLQFKQQRGFSILFTFWVTSLLEEVTLVSFSYSFYLVFVSNILLVNPEVSHNKNNAHSEKYCFDYKTDIYGGAYQFWVIENVGVFKRVLPVGDRIERGF